MSPTDVSTITFHQVLDCNKCLLMTDRSFRRGRLALAPSVAFDKHIGRGLVLEHHDRDALQQWEGRLRQHLRGRNLLWKIICSVMQVHVYFCGCLRKFIMPAEFFSKTPFSTPFLWHYARRYKFSAILSRMLNSTPNYYIGRHFDYRSKRQQTGKYVICCNKHTYTLSYNLQAPTFKQT